MLRIRFTLLALILVGMSILAGCDTANLPNQPIGNDSTAEKGSAETSAVLAAPSANQWHNYPQWARNQLILEECAKYPNYSVGKNTDNCKEWVRDRIREASGGAVIIPSTITSGWWKNARWKYQKYCVGTSFCFTNFGWFSPGEVVQMRLKSGGPHTAIVEWVTPNTIGWVDANWKSGKVYRHSMSVQQFHDKIKCFTKYTIK